MIKENVKTYQKFIIMIVMEVFLISVMYRAYLQTVTSLWISYGIVQFGMFLVGFQIIHDSFKIGSGEQPITDQAHSGINLKTRLRLWNSISN